MKKLLFALVGVSVLAATPAAAATVLFQFTVDITSGALAGETFSGNFSYEATDVVGVSDEFVDLSTFAFNYQGIDFGLDDGVAEAAFFDGAFLGLSYSVDFPAPVFFSFAPGFFSVDEAFFSYEDPDGDGVGSIAYSVVPVPGALVLLASGFIGLAAFRRKS